MPNHLHMSDLTKAEILRLDPKNRLEYVLRIWCRQKLGKLGICDGGNHAQEAEMLYPLLKDMELLNGE